MEFYQMKGKPTSRVDGMGKMKALTTLPNFYRSKTKNEQVEDTEK
jgi:hypothetical protein